MISLIVAHDESRGMGKNNTIPWYIPGELRWVGKVTRAPYGGAGQRNALIMGRKTWESLPESRRPLPDRLTIVISRTITIEHKDVIVVDSLEEAFLEVVKQDEIAKAFVFGGASIYEQALKSDKVDELLVSVVPGHYDADIFFPQIPKGYTLKSQHEFIFDGVSVKHFKYKLN
jgi:dihydrofolate reductase